MSLVTKMRLIHRLAEKISRETPQKSAPPTVRPHAPERRPQSEGNAPCEWESFLVNLAMNYAA